MIVYADEVGANSTNYTTAMVCKSLSIYPVIENIGIDLYEAHFLVDIATVNVVVPSVAKV